VAAAVAGGDSRDKLVKRADDALYHAKSAGRDRVVVRSADM
jgi:PleD family two-component response regulator